MNMPAPNIHGTRSIGPHTLGLMAMWAIIWVVVTVVFAAAPRATPIELVS